MKSFVNKVMKKIETVVKSIMVCLIVLSMFSCKKQEVGSSPKLDSVDKTIMVYLRDNPNYSILTEALDSIGLSGILNLYGSMTMFAPSNDAFAKFFKRKGISGLTGINRDELVKILRNHLYNQKFISGNFQTGSLPAVTASGDLIKMDISKGIKNIYLNNTVKVDTLDIGATNGIVHVINDVLEPSKVTIYSYLAGNPEYSIMAEAIKKTGVDTALLGKIVYDNSLIVNGLPSRKWITSFFETNNILAISGIKSFDDLASKYSNTYKTTKSYTSQSDSLNIFVRYHFMQQKMFLSDFRDDFYESGSTGNWLIFSTADGFTINKRDNIKIDISMDKSNLVTSNGIIHSIDTVLSVYNPKPVIVKGYFAGAPQDRVIKLLDGTVSTFSTQFKNLANDPVAQSVVWWFKWGWTSITSLTIQSGTLRYGTGSLWTNKNPLYLNDFPIEDMDGIWITGNVGLWMELTTKPIFKGKYALYIYHWSNVKSPSIPPYRYKWSLDGVEAPDYVNLCEYVDAYGNDALLYGKGGANSLVKRKLGVFTFDQIMPHKFKWTLVDDFLIIANLHWYKIQFEPVL